MAKTSNSKIYAVALFLFLIGVGWLVYSGFTSNSVYFLNVSEALAAPTDKLQQIRLFGTVAAKDLHKTTDTPGVDFLLEDKDNTNLVIPISFRGAVPDAFKIGAEVIVEGGMKTDKSFAAKTLMTKCPSKYQKENRER
ncbi:MAG: cytochrome c maturation protein CcmE [Desulfovibrionaceae bacterium]|nr:cytochrome c maturation protein CcmE [Desulfovibrionaceae bacterium]